MAGSVICSVNVSILTTHLNIHQVLHFTTTVRCHETRQITVHNKTAVPWVLHPIINGEHWSGPMSFNVPAGGAAHYELTYRPLLMTHDTHKHTVSIYRVHVLTLNAHLFLLFAGICVLPIT